MSAVPVVAALDARDATGRGLRIEFFRLSDRYSHRILAVGCEELPVLLVESVEGTANNPWPPSPAFQALNLEDLQDCDESTETSSVAMLVGMSGSTHWSMSVKSLLQADSHELFKSKPGFYFDAAARLKSVPKILSTRYAAGKRVRVQASGNGVFLHFGSGQAHLDSCTAGGMMIPTAWQIDKRKNELRHELGSELAELHLPMTIRWGYSLSFLAD